MLQETCSPTVNTSPSQVGAYFIFNHVDLEVTYHSGGDEDWAVGFGDNGGRIISVKVPQDFFYNNTNKMEV